MNSYLKSISLFLAATALCSCSVPDWLGAGDNEVRLEGERFEVMSIESKLRIDESAQGETVDIPAATPEVSGNNGNYAFSGSFAESQSLDIGEAADEFFNISAKPIFAEAKFFVLDGSNTVSALDEKLNIIWSKQIISPDDDEQYIPGGIAYSNGQIFVTTGAGKVAALESATGKANWTNKLNVPLRSAAATETENPDSEKIYISSSDNKIFALSAKTGELVWRHTGVEEVTRRFATATPVVKNNIVTAAYASGEIFGLNTTQGRETWADLLSSGQSQTKASASVNDISATPLVADGILYATNAGGKLVAINYSTGLRIWELPIAGVATPWVAGRYLFIINNRSEMVAINRYDGRIKWVKELIKQDAELDKRVKWQGPIMANGALVAHNNLGELIVIDTNTGKTIKRVEIPEEVYTPAIIANGKLYFITNDAQLIELR